MYCHVVQSICKSLYVFHCQCSKRYCVNKDNMRVKKYNICGSCGKAISALREISRRPQLKLLTLRPFHIIYYYKN